MNLYNYHIEPHTLDYHDHRYEIVPDLILEKYKNNLSKLEHYKPLFTKVDRDAYNFAVATDKSFPEGESVISKSSRLSVMYAQNVLHHDFKPGEKSIASSPRFSYLYASRVLHKPFPLGEKAIASDPFYAQQYTNEILHHDFIYDGKLIAKYKPQ